MPAASRWGSRPLLAAHAAVAEAGDLNRLLAPGEQADLAALLGTHQLIDVLRRWPAAWDAAELIAALRPLAGCLGTEISAQVAALANGGDAKIHYIDTMGWTAQGDFTDGVHPNESGSVKIADKLVTALQALPD